MTTRSAKNLARFLALLVLLLLAWVLRDFWRVSDGTGSILGRFSPTWAVVFAGFGLFAIAAGAAAAWAVVRPGSFLNFVGRVEASSRRLPRWARVLVGVGLLLLPPALLLGHGFDTLQIFSLRVLLTAMSSFAAALFLPMAGWAYAPRLSLALMGSASIYLVADRLTLVTDYPFSLGWSEGNRLWDYSLYFGGRPYSVAGEFSYPSYLTPGRHGLWGLPFLIPHVSIQAVRLWDAVLWTAPYLLLGFALVPGRRTVLDRYGRWAFALWSLLFVSQGPVYAPLVVSGIILALGYDSRRPGRTALFAAGACFYAGISRWTWLVAPAMLGGMWALVESAPGPKLFSRLRTPVVVGLACLAGAVGSQVFMRLAFPQPEAPFATTVRQALLWYRLLPSPTNPIGVVPALAIVAGPIVILFAVWTIRRVLRWDWIQVGGIVAVLVAFLAVGLAASAKIGGGSNLHNLDMFLVGLIFLVGIVLTALGDQLIHALDRAAILVALVVWIPSAAAVVASPPLDLQEVAVARSDLDAVRQAAFEASREGEVLFIDQRQLFTFGQVGETPLVMDYELKDLMNQAMGANRSYLDRFHEDLANHRFALIVVDPIVVAFQGRYRAFGEENDAWVEHVAIPLLDSYETSACLEAAGVCLYVPKE